MKRLLSSNYWLVALITLCFSVAAYGQTTIWRKVFPWGRISYTYTMELTNSEIVFTSLKNTGRGVPFDFTLTKLSANGDSILTVLVPVVSPTTVELVKCNDNSFYLVCGSLDYSRRYDSSAIQIIKYDEHLGQQWSLYLSAGNSQNIKYANTVWHDNSLFISGITVNTNGRGVGSSGFLARVLPFGAVEWIRPFTLPYSGWEIRGITPTSNSSLLLTGAFNDYLGGFEIDTMGNRISQDMLFQQGVPGYGITGGQCLRLADGTFLVAGYQFLGGPGKTMLLRLNSDFTVNWSSFSDTTSYFYNSSAIDNSYFGRRIDNINGVKWYRISRRSAIDDQIIWSFDPNRSPGLLGVEKFYIGNIINLANGDGLTIGRRQLTNNSEGGLFLSRFTNAGVPNNPLSLPESGPRAIATAFPNPATDQFTLSVAHLPAPYGILDLINAAGQVVSTQTWQENQPINLESLPAGLYHYRLRVGGKVVSGRVVKR